MKMHEKDNGKASIPVTVLKKEKRNRERGDILILSSFFSFSFLKMYNNSESEKDLWRPCRAPDRKKKKRSFSSPVLDLCFIFLFSFFFSGFF